MQRACTGNTRARHAASLKHTERLGIFIAQLGPSIKSVKLLHITLGSSTGHDICETADTIAATAMLLPLASACPLIQRLAVTGRMGPSFLQAFGTLCPQLTSLRASLTNLAPSTLALLSTLLPNLTSLCMLPSRPYYHNMIRFFYGDDTRQPADHVLSNAAACIALKSCPQLQHFDTAFYDMTEEVWAALPPGLVSCTTAGAGHGHRNIPSPLPEWQPHVGLHSIGITAETLLLPELAQLLTSAPNLAFVVLNVHKTQSVFACSSAGLEENLTCLNKRMEAGLAFVTRKSGPVFSPTPTEMVLSYVLAPGSSVSSFMAASMPALAGFTRLQFYGTVDNTAGDLAHLPRIFPSLQEVGFQNLDIDGGCLQTLASCPALTRMKLRGCEGVTRVWLTQLCAVSVSLRQLVCKGCRGISVSDGLALERKRWGRRGAEVEVLVTRGSALEEEDERERQSRLRARKR